MNIKIIKESLKDNIIFGKNQLLSKSYCIDGLLGTTYFYYYALNKNRVFPFIYIPISNNFLSSEYQTVAKRHQAFLQNDTIIITQDTFTSILSKHRWRKLNEFKLNSKTKLITSVKTEKTFFDYSLMFYDNNKKLFVGYSLESNFPRWYVSNFAEAFGDANAFIDYNVVYNSIFE